MDLEEEEAAAEQEQQQVSLFQAIVLQHAGYRFSQPVCTALPVASLATVLASPSHSQLLAD